jgi:flagellar motility protein MotE (MotC chaperone)
MRKKIYVIAVSALLCSGALAEIKSYQSMDNSGLNKKERIESVELYLSELSSTLKSMEAKLLENSSKMKEFENTIKVLATKNSSEASVEQQKNSDKNRPRPTGDSADKNELEKLKADILSLKNNDIEKLKMDYQDLNETVKVLQATVREQLEVGNKKQIIKN